MGKRTEYTPGTFCAVDLAAADVERGKTFYTGLFDWEHGDPYREWTPSMLDGKIVAGIFSQPDDQREADRISVRGAGWPRSTRRV